MAQLPPMARGSPPAGNVRRAPGIAGDRDNMWEVLHRREGSNSPRQRESPLRAAGQEAAGQRAGSVPARNVGVPPGELPPRPPNNEAQREWTPSGRYQRRSVGWEVPKAAFPDPAAEVNLNDQRYDMKAGLKNELRHKILNLEAASQDAHSWLERRLESSQADQRADLSRRWGNFEQGDRRFKDWVTREHEDLAGQMQQVKAASVESQQQSQRQTTALATQCQRLELRLQEVESLVTQADAKANGLAHAVQVAGAAHVAGSQSSNASSGAIQGAIEALRVDLDREAVARAQLGAEATEKIKELHAHIAAVNERQEHEAYSRQQHLVEQSSRSQARVAALEPSFETLRSEIDAMREQLKRGGGDCMRRCDEVESACIQKVADVREAALRAARETAEEHNNVLAECRTSIASLQQILEAKDKIASQLQNLTQQQLHDDKEGLLHRLLQGDDALRGRLSEVEAALAGEQSARLEAQHSAGAHVGRMGIALEQAQASWLKESERMNAELQSIRRQADRAVDGEARGWERRLAESVDSMHRRLDDIESKSHATKASAKAAEDKVVELARSQENSIGEAEARLRRQVDDLQAMQAGRLSQCDFDLRAAMRSGIAEQAERARAELARVEEGAAVERGLLRASLDDIGKESEARFARLREDFERRLAVMDENSSRRAVQATEALTQLRKQLSNNHNEARAYADRVAQDARTSADLALAKFVEDVARETAKAEQTVSEIAREIASSEARLQDLIVGVDTKAASQLQDGLKLERERTQNELERLFDEERSSRMQAEAERLASLQKRLGAHEDLTTRRLEDLKVRQDDAFAAHRQRIEAMMVQDKKETANKFEEMAREQKANSAAVAIELDRIDAAHDRLNADLVQGLENTATLAEEGRTKLEDRMQRELAAFGAKLTVCMTTASTELRHGLKAADDKLASGLAETAVNAESSNKVLQKALEAKVDTVGAALAAHALESAAARASIRSEVEAHKTELDKKIQECDSTAEARDVALDTKIIALEQWSEEMKKQVDQQGADLGSKIADVSTKAEARKIAVDGRFQDMSTQMEAQEAVVKKQVDDIEARLAASQEETSAALTTMKDEIHGEMTSSLATIEASIEALDEREAADINAEQESRRSLVERIDALDGVIKEDSERAQVAEAELQKRVDELQKQFGDADEDLGKKLEDLQKQCVDADKDLGKKLESVQKQLSEADAELGKQLDSLRDQSDGAVGAELRRATAAEGEIMEMLEKQKADLLEAQASGLGALEEKQNQAFEQQLETLRSERNAALTEERDKIEQTRLAVADVAKQLEAREVAAQDKFKEMEERHKIMIDDFKAETKSGVEATKNELQTAIREIDERQLKQNEECKTEAKTNVEATKNELQAMIREIDERQVKQHQECKTEAKTDLQVTKNELQAMIREIDERQVKQLDEYKGELQSQAQTAKGEQQAAIEATKNELQAAIREIEERQVQVNDESTEATKNELQAMIHEIDERQVRQNNECKIEAKAQVEAAKNELQSKILELDERQNKQNDECKTEAKTGVETARNELQAMIREIDDRQVKQKLARAQAKICIGGDECSAADLADEDSDQEDKSKETDECYNVDWTTIDKESSVKVPAASAVQSDEVANTAPVVEAEESLGQGVADNVEKAYNKMDGVCVRLGCASELASRCVGTGEKAFAKKKAAECAAANASWAGERDLSKAEPVLKENSDLIATSNTVLSELPFGQDMCTQGHLAEADEIAPAPPSALETTCDMASVSSVTQKIQDQSISENGEIGPALPRVQEIDSEMSSVSSAAQKIEKQADVLETSENKMVSGLPNEKRNSEFPFGPLQQCVRVPSERASQKREASDCSPEHKVKKHADPNEIANTSVTSNVATLQTIQPTEIPKESNGIESDFSQDTQEQLHVMEDGQRALDLSSMHENRAQTIETPKEVGKEVGEERHETTDAMEDGEMDSDEPQEDDTRKQESRTEVVEVASALAQMQQKPKEIDMAVGDASSDLAKKMHQHVGLTEDGKIVSGASSLQRESPEADNDMPAYPASRQKKQEETDAIEDSEMDSDEPPVDEMYNQKIPSAFSQMQQKSKQLHTKEDERGTKQHLENQIQTIDPATQQNKASKEDGKGAVRLSDVQDMFGTDDGVIAMDVCPENLTQPIEAPVPQTIEVSGASSAQLESSKEDNDIYANPSSRQEAQEETDAMEDGEIDSGESPDDEISKQKIVSALSQMQQIPEQLDPKGDDQIAMDLCPEGMAQKIETPKGAGDAASEKIQKQEYLTEDCKMQADESSLRLESPNDSNDIVANSESRPEPKEDAMEDGEMAENGKMIKGLCPGTIEAVKDAGEPASDLAKTRQKQAALIDRRIASDASSMPHESPKADNCMPGNPSSRQETQKETDAMEDGEIDSDESPDDEMSKQKITSNSGDEEF